MSGEPPVDEKAWYQLHCKSQFEQLEKAGKERTGKIDEILSLLRGRNGDPGLFEQMRDTQQVGATLATAVTAHEATLHGQPDTEDDTGLVGRVQGHHRVVKYLAGAVVFFCTTIVVQGVSWVFGHFTGDIKPPGTP